MQITVTFNNIDEMREFTEKVLVGSSTGDLKESPARKNPEPAASVETAGVPTNVPAATPQQAPIQPVPPAAQPMAPVQPAAPVAPAAPVTPPPMPAQQPVPTAQKTYTADEIARAAMPLIDSGRQMELIGLLQQFGVAAIPELKPDQLGAFATALRGMGAQI